LRRSCAQRCALSWGALKLKLMRCARDWLGPALALPLRMTHRRQRCAHSWTPSVLQPTSGWQPLLTQLSSSWQLQAKQLSGGWLL
jgi:hypothetical protein